MASTPPDSQDSIRRKEVAERRPQRSGWGGIFEPAILTWRLFWDSRVSPLPKLIPLGAVVYFLSPVDILPELALGPLGMIDDVGLLILALNLFIAVCPPDIVMEHREQLGSSGRDSNADDVVEGSATITDESPKE